MAEEHMPEVAEGPEGSDENVKHEDVPVSSAPPQTQDQVSVLTTPAAVPSFPPPKTDKPRPHVCLTCTRSFARLEHLKRHERSHTKEKPFECQSCTRCFARRDLLLRHQQKLHSATTPSSRPRNGRRESTTGVATGRVRKNSVASTTGQTMRPRANTLSHIDTTNAGMMPTAGLYSNRPFVPLHNHTNSFSTISHMSAFPGARGFGYSNNAMTMMGLPRLDTNAASADMSSGLRTAPPYAGFPSDLEFDMMAYDGQSNITINPHELHIPSMHGLGIGQGADVMTGAGMYDSYLSSSAILDEESTFDWGPGGFDHNMAFLGVENAIESSPSAMDTNSPVNYADSHLSRATTQTTPATQSIKAVWQTPLSTAHNNNSNAGHHHTQLNSPARGLNGSTHYGDMMSNIPSDHISPKSLLAQNNPGLDTCFTVALEATVVDGASIGGFPTLPFNHDSIPSTASTASMDSSMRYNSIANCGDLVTDNLRAATIASIAQFTGFGQRRQSAPVVSSPLTPGGNTKLKGFNPNTFPSTADLQRYTNAYFRFCHPHLPFFHLPTLNFESPDYSSSMWNSNSYSNYGIGGSCLLLSITAIGALYENEAMISRELFEYAKRTISSYLEGRRKVSANRTLFASANHGSESEDTPLWLVQAMLLNVVYGHNCGDKTAADVASNHCAALVSLARGAELAKPYPSFVNTDSWAGGPGHESAEAEWLEWITVEERKRTLYSIFVLSSMLVMAYNRAPALTNSEIRLDLPCDEDLWSADSAQSWRALGGIAVVKSRSVPFSGALTHLLTAAQRERQAAEHSMGLDGWRSETSAGMLRPSSFGCLVLIDALHNYIWETRQRHLGRQWTLHEIEAMHAHIEPALRAWSTAWSSNPLHVIERPNPFGAGPLPADSIPLLDLAYVRLFVDFGRSKEAYWQRDYDGMAQELANSSSSSKTDLAFSPIAQQQYSPPHHDLSQLDLASDGSLILPASTTQSTRRERHLRKAAFYAADHLINSDRFGTAFIEKTSRDLPMQSVLCACDSAQVLSEWVTTLQERVGKHLGVLGNDKIEFDEVPCTLMTDDEDRKLLARIDELLLHSERTSENPTALQNARQGGYGSRILVLTSQTMARAAVWPTTKLMSRSLEIQARHIVDRVISSMS